jgi:D-3-phosphoglycerate dehydrogenase
MHKILVSPSSFGECGSEPLELLKARGYEVILNPYGRKLSENEIIALASDITGVVAGVETYNEKILDKLTNLRCISRVGVGVDSINLAYAKEKGIEVLITPEGPTQAVAELSIGLAIDQLRRISVSDRRIRSGIWKKEIGNLINGKTVGIIGLGRIGKRTATLYKALGCHLIAFDKYPDLIWMEENEVSNVSFDQLLKTADIISIHVPGTEDGIPLISRSELEITKTGVIIINLSRGGVVDEMNLYEYLKNNPLSFAALDVFNIEPYNGPLAELENVILTPHLGSYASEAKLGMEIDAVKNLVEYLK